MKVQTKLLLTLAVLTAFPLFSALSADSTGKNVEITVSVGNGDSDNPMIVLWLEDDAGEFIQTLHMFSKRKIHYDKLKGWEPKSKRVEDPAAVDAVSGATVGWNQSSTISIPAQIGSINLLSGRYILCIESRTHFGENYRSLKIPLPEDFTGSVFENVGCIKLIDVKVKNQTN